ncbi:MAG: FKBP-type peptidyl-prolyl cis-trans isomerase [Chitinophagaceae bacterium]|nr:FKBP-type peptidyl-prolyl cis-trans isomerase [Chitinophagaceae bacterium]
MYKKFLIIIALPFLIIACSKSSNTANCTPSNPTIVAPAAEVTALEAYLAGKGLLGSVTRHPNNFYYRIDTDGSGITANTCSNVRVSYEGKLTNDNTFTSAEELNNPQTYTLNQLIPGWQLGLQLIKKGGKIKLYLPPSLGYGSNTAGTIPANSILIFEISLVDVTN